MKTSSPPHPIGPSPPRSSAAGTGGMNDEKGTRQPGTPLVSDTLGLRRLTCGCGGHHINFDALGEGVPKDLADAEPKILVHPGTEMNMTDQDSYSAGGLMLDRGGAEISLWSETSHFVYNAVDSLASSVREMMGEGWVLRVPTFKQCTNLERAVRTVTIESPYAGAVELNTRYARACVHDCLTRGEAPFASHLLYTQEGVLDDGIPDERTQGIDAGLALAAKMDARVVYTDLGISGGMEKGIAHAMSIGQEIEYRTVPGAAGPDGEKAEVESK